MNYTCNQCPNALIFVTFIVARQQNRAMQCSAAAHIERHARRLPSSLGHLAAPPAPANDAGRPAHTGQLPPYLVRLVSATPGLGEAIAAARAKLDADIFRERQRMTGDAA